MRKPKDLVVPEGMKWCPACENIKTRESFSRGSNADLLQSRCRACMAQSCKRWHDTHYEDYKVENNARKRRRYPQQAAKIKVQHKISYAKHRTSTRAQQKEYYQRTRVERVRAVNLYYRRLQIDPALRDQKLRMRTLKTAWKARNRQAYLASLKLWRKEHDAEIRKYKRQWYYAATYEATKEYFDKAVEKKMRGETK